MMNRHLDSYHGHRAEYPTPGQAWATVIGIALVVVAVLM